MEDTKQDFVRGFEQEEGVNYSETFSPVTRHVSIRLLLSLAASNRMSLIMSKKPVYMEV